MPESRIVATSSIHNRLKRGRRFEAALKFIAKQAKERCTTLLRTPVEPSSISQSSNQNGEHRSPLQRPARLCRDV